MTKQKVALVLSMGGARGIAHIGVIETLLKHHFEITSITGSSMGAMVGAMYATGKLEECKNWFCSWNRWKMLQMADVTISRSGLVKGNRFIRELGRIIPDVSIESLPLPYTALATDIAHDEEVRFVQGSLLEAIRASMSIPMLFCPVRKNGRVLVDGGILNPLPIRHAPRKEDALLIAVDVNAPSTDESARRFNPYLILTKSSRLMMQEITRREIAQYSPDLLIQMSGDEYDMMDFHRAASIVESGKKAAEEALALSGY